MKAMKSFDTLVLAKDYPEAFKALPEPYQADSVLEFWLGVGINPSLYCQPTREQEKILGKWAAVFQDGSWIDLRDLDIIARKG